MLPEKKTPVNLRTVAQRVGLAPCSVSAVLNNTVAARAIPQVTKERVFRAAAELNYRPNLWARSLRTKRTRMVAAVAPDFGRGAVARVLAGLQSRLHERGYLLVLGTLDCAESSYGSVHFQQSGFEGVIAIDSVVPRSLDLPVASVDLRYMGSAEPLSDEMRTWLRTLGESAADTMIQQIESQNISRRMKVDPKLPPAYFHLQDATIGQAMARESA